MTKFTPYIFALIISLIVSAVLYMAEAQPNSQGNCDHLIKPMCTPGLYPVCVCPNYTITSCHWQCTK